MNKAELAQIVREKLGPEATQASAERALDAVIDAIAGGLRDEGEVSLVGFGVFNLGVRPARKGFNPHTRKPMRIPALKTVRFRAGAELKKRVKAG